MSIAFPDEFPFNRRRDEAGRAAAQPADVPALTAEPGVLPPPGNLQSQALAVCETVRVAPAPLGMERRRSARQTLVARATIKPESNYMGCGPLAAGYVSNISMKGVGFHTRRPLIVGESYKIKLEIGPLNWQSRLRVVTCKEHASGTFDVGAEFIANELAQQTARGIAA